jgi:curved DNA-binding protein CbpA
MIRSLLPYFFTAVAAVTLRDLECFVAAKIFCWRKRRQTQREAKENRELRELQTKLAAAEEVERQARIAKARIAAASSVPFPQLVGGPLIITARSREEVYSLCRRISSNIASQQTVNNFSESSFENN